MAVYRGEIPAWDPFAIDERISTEPAITHYYNYVLCDTPPELFPPTIWGLYAADYIVIPSNMEELSMAGVKLFLKEVLPSVMMRSKHTPKVLGVALTNVVRRFKRETLETVNRSLVSFLRGRSTLASGLPTDIVSNIYERPLFETVIHRHGDLRDLLYTPQKVRWGRPLDRVIGGNKELRGEVEALTAEILGRIESFRGMA